MSARIAKAADDTAILRLFREWIAEHELAERLDGAEFEAAVDRLSAIEFDIADARAVGPIGFAIKAYLVLHVDHQGGAVPGGMAGLDPSYYGEKPELYLSCRALIGLLRDAAAVVPEIARLAAPIIHRTPRARRRRGGKEKRGNTVIKFPVDRIVRRAGPTVH